MSYKYPPTILPSVERIIAIGDIHGDMNLTIKSLRLGGVIDKDNNWCGGKTVVVQVGDQVDGCRPQLGECNLNGDLDVVALFSALHQQAKQDGGAVYSLLGNHEILNFQGVYDYVSHSDMKDRDTIFKRGSDLAIDFAQNRPVVLIIGSNLFVHAGIVPQTLEFDALSSVPARTQLEYINRMMHQWLLNEIDIHPLFNDQELSPIWTRHFAEENEQTCKTSDQILDVLKLNRMIIGHSPQYDIKGSCRNTIFRIDGGFSEAFAMKRKIQILEITKDNIFKIINEN